MSTQFPAQLPRAAAWLGYGGLLPFVGLGIASLVDIHHARLWCSALFSYGAVILSFVGALHWAFAMTLDDLSEPQRNARFIWSVVPALVAWAGLLLKTAPVAGVLLIMAFVAHFWHDRRLASHAALPAWYLPLRLRLTLVACASIAAGGLSLMRQSMA